MCPLTAPPEGGGRWGCLSAIENDGVPIAILNDLVAFSDEYLVIAQSGVRRVILEEGTARNGNLSLASI